MPPKPDVFCSQCKSRAVLDQLAARWSLLILHCLISGPKRTSELRRCVDGISEKMLIQTLRDFERSGFVSRRSYPEIPPRVEYELTDLGASLATLVEALDHWVEANFAKIDRAQRAFDNNVMRGRA
jgi:DNA-binding HxlR family transcriptional regulator